jgi:hypothetical protein
VGKCNRLDKCGYHYTPREYFTDNPWKRENDFSFFRFNREKEKKKIENPPHQYFTDNPWKRENDFSFFRFNRENEKMKIENSPTRHERGNC